jgi:hypothetical protein
LKGQIALATALQRSAEVNYFQDRLDVRNAYIDLDELIMVSGNIMTAQGGDQSWQVIQLRLTIRKMKLAAQKLWAISTS